MTHQREIWEHLSSPNICSQFHRSSNERNAHDECERNQERLKEDPSSQTTEGKMEDIHQDPPPLGTLLLWCSSEREEPQRSREALQPLLTAADHNNSALLWISKQVPLFTFIRNLEKQVAHDAGGAFDL